jgi:hypothetical protein
MRLNDNALIDEEGRKEIRGKLNIQNIWGKCACVLFERQHPRRAITLPLGTFGVPYPL